MYAHKLMNKLKIPYLEFIYIFMPQVLSDSSVCGEEAVDLENRQRQVPNEKSLPNKRVKYKLVSL